MQSIGSFSTPELSQEEEKSSVLPANMHCSACRAVTYQMSVQLPAVKSKSSNLYTNKKGQKKVKESAYLEAFDKICHGEKDKPDSGLGGYGVKPLNGVNVLSGPGLPAASQPGILMGGSKWPGRLGNKCGEMLGELGEEEIWTAFSSGENLFKTFCQEECTEEELEEELKDEKEGL